jgi:hypothetical protein
MKKNEKRERLEEEDKKENRERLVEEKKNTILFFQNFKLPYSF